jgi:Protein of unknown function (DUF3800)
MYFHIDESGNTGNNLFDPNQQQLSYGVLSSKKNVDVLGKPFHLRMLKELGETEIHANELGVRKLTKISELLYKLQIRMKFDFDYFYIVKPDFALVCFFEAVFDQGLNEAVKWDTYWTPFRYPMILNLSTLFDEALLKESWRLCKHKRIHTQKNSIIKLLKALSGRAAKSALDDRSKELIRDALNYGIAYPLKLDFGISDERMLSPNTIGFQFVVSCMGRRLKKGSRNRKKKKEAANITVDEQTQFNKYQIKTHKMKLLVAEGMKGANKELRSQYLSHPLFNDMQQSDIQSTFTPRQDITIKRSKNSIGLQIVDTYLWIINKLLKGDSLSTELKAVASLFLPRSDTDGISIDGLMERFDNFEQKLPPESSISAEKRRLNDKLIDRHRKKVATLGI